MSIRGAMAAVLAVSALVGCDAVDGRGPAVTGYGSVIRKSEIARIGSDGGVLESSFGVDILVPARALAAETELKAAVWSDGEGEVRLLLGPAGLVFAESVTVIVPIDDADPGAVVDPILGVAPIGQVEPYGDGFALRFQLDRFGDEPFIVTSPCAILPRSCGVAPNPGQRLAD